MNFFSRYKLHLLFWGVYFLFWTLLSIFNYNTPPLMAIPITVAWFIGQASICYLCIYLLIPRYFNGKRYLLFALLLLAGLQVSTLFILGSLVLFYELFSRPLFGSLRAEFLYILLGNFYTVFLIVALKSIKDKIKNDNRNQLLEKEKTETELRFLKSQMNPHFLFNAINSIYVLIKKDADLAALTLIKFADMLRYQLYECNSDKIPIEKEISYINNYVEIEKLRKGNAIQAYFQVDDHTRNFDIAPLLIIPFVENAFKYVSTWPDKANFVKVEMNIKDDLFELKVENSIDEDSLVQRDRSWGGIGLENVRRRLELIYKGCHSLDIRSTELEYAVVLTIKIE